MRKVFALTRLLHSVLLASFLTGFSTAVAQSPVIEPCPATPSQKSSTLTGSVSATIDRKASQTLIDSKVANDANLEKLLAPYTDKVRALSLVVGRLDGDLKKGRVGAGTLGNFVTDAMLAEAKRRSRKNITLAIMNAGGLRKNEIAAGTLRASDIFELLPFENDLIVLQLNGSQLSKLVRSLLRDAQSGSKIQYRWNEQNRTEFLSAKLVDTNGREKDIDDNETYLVVTIDYLYNLKSGTYALLREAKDVKPLDITLREAVINFVKSETAAGRPIKATLDNRFVQVGPGPAHEDWPND